jgi:hypothetical protein
MFVHESQIVAKFHLNMYIMLYMHAVSNMGGQLVEPLTIGARWHGIASNYLKIHRSKHAQVHKKPARMHTHSRVNHW